MIGDTHAIWICCYAYFLGNDLKYETKVVKDLAVDESDMRYFTCDDRSVADMEAAVLDEPSNVDLWLKLSHYQLLNKAK